MKVELRNGISFCDEDVVELDDWIPAGESNPHNVRPWLIHDHGFTLGVTFASSLQDALDILADNDRLNRYYVSETDLGDYPDGEGLAYLGNACEPFDIESIGVVELTNPPASFAAQFAAMQSPVLAEPDGPNVQIQ